MPKFRIFTTILIATLISGCQFTNPIAKPLTSDKHLKTVQKIKTISESTAIAFEWLPFSDSPHIAGYKIYREELDDGKLNFRLIATLNDRIASHYVDSELNPNTSYKYTFIVFTNDNRKSTPSKPVIAKTLAMLKPIHYIIPVSNLANKTKLLWRPHQNIDVSGYIIERNDVYSKEWKKVGELNNRLNVEFIDTDLETNRAYKYRVRVKTFNGVVSNPSKIVETLTKALPKPIVDITASSELPKEIKISWRRNDDVNIQGYNIYRSKSNDGTFDLIAEVKDNSYSDQIVEDGKQMFYKVSAVDKSGLESIVSNLPIMGNTLFKPKPPKITTLKADSSEIFLKWIATDPRTLKYKIIRKKGNSWIKKDEIFFSVDKTEYLDKDVVLNQTYSYQIIAIDKFGIESIPTEKSEITLQRN